MPAGYARRRGQSRKDRVTELEAGVKESSFGHRASAEGRRRRPTAGFVAATLPRVIPSLDCSGGEESACRPALGKAGPSTSLRSARDDRGGECGFCPSTPLRTKNASSNDAFFAHSALLRAICAVRKLRILRFLPFGRLGVSAALRQDGFCPSTPLRAKSAVRISRISRFLRIWGARFWGRKRAAENKRPQKTQKPQKP